MASGAWRPKNLTWQVAPRYDGAEEMARRLGTVPLVAQILHNRGIEDADAAGAFMNPKLADLHDPQLLGGVVPAAELIAKAVAAGKKFIIYGDYDVDGITAVAILHTVLKMVGADVHYYVPHRLGEGYGVNIDAVRKLIENRFDVMITVDCGISAAGPLAAASDAGVEIIVTDHHTIPEHLPPAAAIVHPNLPQGRYPNRDLSGAGVAFKLAWQIARKICGEKRVDQQMRDFLLDATCLAALGTIADVVPITGENRILATHGLRGLPASRHPGLRALIESAGLTGKHLDAYHVGFVLAPRLNACGRMGHANLAVDLLADAPAQRCAKIAKFLAKQNTDRQKVQRAITAEAVEMVIENRLDSPAHLAIVLASDQWHGGVVGIVASAIVRQFHRPAVLITFDSEGAGQGSARSIAGFHMAEALAACSEHLSGFGGHAMAGGLKIQREKFDDFAAAFGDYARTHIKPEQLQATLKIDAETTLARLSLNVVEHLRRLAPFGQGNAPPTVAVRACRVLIPPKRMGRNGQTAGLMLEQSGAALRAVGFGMGDLADMLVGINHVDVAGEPVLNTFNGVTTVELKLKDVRWD